MRACARLGVLALAAFAATPAQAAPSIGPIQVSTTSGVAPLSVHFDATATTDSAYPRPFHSLQYLWSFGDPQSGTWTHSGRSKNEATGAIAVHLFETPGTYEVTLVVTNPRGESSAAAVTVSVRDPSEEFSSADTYCYANPGEDFAGCPRPCPSENCVHASSVEQAFDGRLAPGTRHYFRRGDRFAMTQPVFLTQGGSRAMIAAFGSGPKPILDTNLLAEDARAFSAGTDWRIGQLTLTGTRGIPLANAGNDSDRLLIWDVDATGFHGCFVVTGYGNELVTVHDFSCTQLRPNTTEGAWLVFDHADRASYQGLLVDGAGNPSANGIFRTVGTSRSVISNNRLVAGENLGILSLRSCGAGSQAGCTAGMPNRFLQIADNQLVAASAIPLRTCTVNSCAHSDTNGNDAIDFIWERNFLTLASLGTTVNILWWIQGGDQTLRNNVIDLSGANVASAARVILEQSGPTSPGGANRNNLHFVNNTIVSTSALPQLVACGYTASGGSGHRCYNNLIYAPLAGATAVAEDDDWSESNNLASYTPALPFEANLPAIPARDLDDFQLADDAAAVDAGLDLAGSAPVFVATDAFQRCRPAGSAFDVGAHELGAVSCLAPEPSASLLGVASIVVLAGVAGARRPGATARRADCAQG